MKTKSTIRNLVIAGMGAAMISAAVGSIGGTVAWFQYNTRATAAYTGAAAKCTENLQIRIYDASLIGSELPYADANAYKTVYKWGSEISTKDIENFIKVKRGHWDSIGSEWVIEPTDTSLYPVTSGNLAADKVATTLYGNPDKAYAREDYATWDPAGLDKYVEIPLQFRLLDVNGENAASGKRNYISKSLYLSDLDISAKTVDNKKDITNALRVSFKDNAAPSIERTFSLHGTDVDVHGKLDLEPDGTLDYVYVDENGSEVTYDYQAHEATPGTKDTREVDYGGEKINGEFPVAKSTKISTFVADVSGEKKYAPVGDAFGTLVAGTDDTADNLWYTVTMRIYLEGWQKLEGYATNTEDSTLWSDLKYVGSQVNVGMTFNVAAIK